MGRGLLGLSIIKDRRKVSFEEEGSPAKEKGSRVLEMHLLRWAALSKKGEDPLSGKCQMVYNVTNSCSFSAEIHR